MSSSRNAGTKSDSAAISHKNLIVSSDLEELILVDEHDKAIGFATKERCHDAGGILHRAFSLFVFNSKGQLLLQQRSDSKRLWPLYWSNTCCSHPRRGEKMDDATKRRLSQELGFECAFKFVYKFQYQASYHELGAENELCWVYIGESDNTVFPNPHEVASIQWLSPDAVDQQINQHPNHYTPWFKMEWAQIRQHLSQLTRS